MTIETSRCLSLLAGFLACSFVRTGNFLFRQNSAFGGESGGESGRPGIWSSEEASRNVMAQPLASASPGGVYTLGLNTTNRGIGGSKPVLSVSGVAVATQQNCFDVRPAPAAPSGDAHNGTNLWGDFFKKPTPASVCHHHSQGGPMRLQSHKSCAVCLAVAASAATAQGQTIDFQITDGEHIVVNLKDAAGADRSFPYSDGNDTVLDRRGQAKGGASTIGRTDADTIHDPGQIGGALDGTRGGEFLTTASAVPEPGIWALGLLGLAGLAGLATAGRTKRARRLIGFASVAAGAALMASPAVAVEAPLTHDTFVMSSSAASNYGGWGSVNVNGTGARGLLSFDIGSVLPAGVKSGSIQKASLILFVEWADAQGSIEVLRLLGGFNEASSTFQSMPAHTTRGTGRTAALAGSIKPLVVDVTDMVKATIDAQGATLGVALLPAIATPTVAAQFGSKEGKRQARLDITLVSSLTNFWATSSGSDCIATCKAGLPQAAAVADAAGMVCKGNDGVAAAGTWWQSQTPYPGPPPGWYCGHFAPSTKLAQCHCALQ